MQLHRANLVHENAFIVIDKYFDTVMNHVLLDIDFSIPEYFIVHELCSLRSSQCRKELL